MWYYFCCCLLRIIEVRGFFTIVHEVDVALKAISEAENCEEA